MLQQANESDVEIATTAQVEAYVAKLQASQKAIEAIQESAGQPTAAMALDECVIVHSSNLSGFTRAIAWTSKAGNELKYFPLRGDYAPWVKYAESGVASMMYFEEETGIARQPVIVANWMCPHCVRFLVYYLILLVKRGLL
ncbi:MAG: hypothetical protein M3Z04_23405 [Chloroflexota bacterium]|nr:hypothetical protein [Chloroflexota bacterium]